MNEIRLERRCNDLYGKEKGKKLFRAMQQIARNDFCVATGWDEYQLSISRSCNHRGTVCKLSRDYQKLTFPSGHEVALNQLTRYRIERHLQKSAVVNDRHYHCDVDKVKKRV